MAKYPTQRVKIDDICLEVAAYLYHMRDTKPSPTTIRTHINDAIDHWEKEGMKVNHNYSQPRAVKRVTKVISDLVTMSQAKGIWEAVVS